MTAKRVHGTPRDPITRCEPPPVRYRHDEERIREKYQRCVRGLLDSLEHQGCLTRKQEHRIKKPLHLDEHDRGKDRCSGDDGDAS